jgi:hypothetical protein
VKVIDQARHDLNGVLAALPAGAPMFACVAIVTALDHLCQAAVTIDQAADQLDKANTPS